VRMCMPVPSWSDSVLDGELGWRFVLACAVRPQALLRR
jgi:hypothetical protein